MLMLMVFKEYSFIPYLLCPLMAGGVLGSGNIVVNDTTLVLVPVKFTI